MKKISFTVLMAFIALSLVAQIKIMAPALVSPENEDENQMPDVVLDWDAVSGIGVITYELQLDEDSSFPNPTIFTTDFSSSEMENLYFGQEYNWRVRASDDNGTGDWSEIFTFTLFDEVILNKPNDEDDEIMPNEVLKWKNKAGSGSTAVFITGVAEFEYQVSYDDAFTNIYIDGAVSAENFEVACAELRFDTTYYWHVRAIHAMDETEWSETWSFSTIIVPELDNPDDEEGDQMIDVTLEWDEIEGAFEYKYQVCTDPSFTSPCTDATVNTNEVTLQPLMFGVTYYWRVSAMHTQDTSIWTEAWSFETINTVYLMTPIVGDTVDLFPLLEWEEQTGIESYEMQYSTSDAFVDAEINHIDVPEASYKINFSLDEEMEYFWRVRAIRDGDTSEWSATWNFYTPFPPIGINNNILQKENVQIYPNPSAGVLNVELNPKEKSMVQISVMDLLGQKVYDNRMNFDQGKQIQMIDLNMLENGLYILRLESGSNIYNQKFILDK